MSTATADDRIYKDKIEVSLDGRQIFYLFFGAAVLVGLVFVIGVMVGRRVESRSHVDSLGHLDHARAATDPLAALDGLEGKKLSFQTALVKTSVPTDVEHQIDQLEQARTEPKPGKPAAAVAVIAEPKKDDKKPEKPDDKPITKPDQVKAKPELAKAEKKSEKADKKKVEDARPINGDVVTASDDKPIEKPKADKPADKSADKAGKFTLQLSSFQDKKEAENFLSSVKAGGFGAYLTEGEVNGKTYYRVRMGKYGSMEAANDAKADVEKSIKKSASVMRL